MNSKIFLFLIPISIFIYSCQKDDKASKNKKLTELKKQSAEINAQIATLERELGPDATKEENSKEKYVSLVSLDTKPFTHYIEINGKVESDKNITVSARSAGSITTVRVDRGQKVQKGQVLATVDAIVIQRGLEELKSSLNLATIIYDKQKNLWDQQIGTEIQYLQAKNNKESLERKIASLNEQYEMSFVKSTIDGTVDEVFIREGENIAPGIPAFRVVGGKDYKIVAEIPETYLTKVSSGNEVEVFLPDTKETFKSKISNVSNVIGSVNRTFVIEIPVNGKIKSIKGNMIANVKIKDYNANNAIVVPINVIQHAETGEYLFVANGKQAKRKDVQVGHTYKTYAEITKGLQSGDKIITTGYMDLVDGQAIKF